MKKEPIGLYLFRFTLGFGLFAFMAMLYWSSLLLEDDLKEVQSDVEKVQENLQDVLLETQKMRHELLQAIRQGQQTTRTQAASSLPVVMGVRPHIDPSLPNLLEEDKFYAETLPQLVGPNFRPKGTRRAATIGKPANLHPFSNWAQISEWNSMCQGSVATAQFGKMGTFAPDMGIKIEQRSDSRGRTEFWVHLRDDLYWEPLDSRHFPDSVDLAAHFRHRHPVTAHDFKFHFDAVMNPHVDEAGAASLRTYLSDIEEIRVVDDLTFVVRWKEVNGKVKFTAKMWTGALTPLATWIYQYFPDGTKIVDGNEDADTYRTNSVWAQNFGQHWARNIIASCGPWIFDGFTDEAIRFRRNPAYYNPYKVLVENYEVRFRESPDAIWQDFKAGKIDTYALRPEQLIELEDFYADDQYEKQSDLGLKINRLDYMGRTYSYVGWNQATPYFSSTKVRRAMTMAIDRQRIIEQNLNGMAVSITGPFFLASPSNDPSIRPTPFNLKEARRLLEEDGWYDSDGDGVIDKEINGKRVPFRFSLTYYVKNPTSKANAEYLATALREVGVECHLNGVDLADLSSSIDEKSFDALFLAWGLGSPPEDPKQLWHSEGAKEPGSSNHSGFANAAADEIIEKLHYEYDEEERLKLYHRFHAIIHAEAPYTFLYTPKSILLYRDYVKNVFIPAERQDLVPGANSPEPSSEVFWLANPEPVR